MTRFSGAVRLAAFWLALLVPGCQLALVEPDATDGPPPMAGPMSRWQRERSMNERWQNRPLSELVDAMGEPRLMLMIPGGGNPPGFVVVYDLDPVTGCVDAFAVYHGNNPKIRIYHCR